MLKIISTIGLVSVIIALGVEDTVSPHVSPDVFWTAVDVTFISSAVGAIIQMFRGK